VGAWGPGPFENDDAMDWLDDLEERGETAIRAALDGAIGKGQPDASAAASAIAAAAIIAASGESTSIELPEDARAWLEQHEIVLRDPLASRARESINRVARDSELRELWDESAELEDWLAAIEQISSTLGSQA
jgi:hypothetical protein